MNATKIGQNDPGRSFCPKHKCLKGVLGIYFGYRGDNQSHYSIAILDWQPKILAVDEIVDRSTGRCNMIYLDNAATTKPFKDVLEQMVQYYEEYYGNPSALHAYGHVCEKALDGFRKELAAFIGGNPEEVFFTSGGTESNVLSIKGLLDNLPSNSEKIIVTTRVEHSSVIHTVEHMTKKGFNVIYIDTDHYGKIILDDLESKLTNQVSLCVFSHVNSETGAIQPIEKISKLVKSFNRNIKIHIDCVQSFGKLNLDVRRIKADTLSFSGHKIHGPKGIGILYKRKNVRISPLFYGGNQENSLRPGTENLPAVAGLMKAVEFFQKNQNEAWHRAERLRERFKKELEKLDGIRFNFDSKSSPYIMSISIKDVKGEVLVHFMEQEEIYLSTGSACSSKLSSRHKVISHVVKDPSYVDGTVRISFGILNGEEEIEIAAKKMKEYVKEIRRVIRGK